MPTKKKVVESDSVQIARSEPVTYGPNEGGNNILAAWQGLTQLFGAEAERFDITDDGVVAVNVTFQPRVEGVTPEMLVTDLTIHGDKPVTRRLDLVELYRYVVDPTNVEPFTNPADLTSWMVSHLKGAGEGDGSRSPQYAKDSITNYKEEHKIAAPRGRRRRIVRLDDLSTINQETLADVKLEELTALQETISRAMAERSAAAMASA